MSSKEVIHSVNNQLMVVLAQAELLAREGCSDQERACCLEIKKAAHTINRLLNSLSD
jgi:hypothetical protein